MIQGISSHAHNFLVTKLSLKLQSKDVLNEQKSERDVEEVPVRFYCYSSNLKLHGDLDKISKLFTCIESTRLNVKLKSKIQLAGMKILDLSELKNLAHDLAHVLSHPFDEILLKFDAARTILKINFYWSSYGNTNWIGIALSFQCVYRN